MEQNINHMVNNNQMTNEQKFPWKIVKKTSLRLIGISTKISCVNNEHQFKIPAFWNECQANGSFAKLVALDQGNPKGSFGLVGNYDRVANELEYSIMVISDAPLEEGFSEFTIPETTWIIFDCVGPMPHTIQNGWNYFHNEWMAQHPFKHAPYPELEWNSDGDIYDTNYLSQIWIPIIEE